MNLTCIAELFFKSRRRSHLSKLPKPSAGVCETPGRNFDAKYFQSLEYLVCFL